MPMVRQQTARLVEEQKGGFAEAETLHRRILKVDPGHTAALRDLIYLVEEHKRDLVEAEKLYRRALELEPHHLRTVKNFALLVDDDNGRRVGRGVAGAAARDGDGAPRCGDGVGHACRRGGVNGGGERDRGCRDCRS